MSSVSEKMELPVYANEKQLPVQDSSRMPSRDQRSTLSKVLHVVGVTIVTYLALSFLTSTTVRLSSITRCVSAELYHLIPSSASSLVSQQPFSTTGTVGDDSADPESPRNKTFDDWLVWQEGRAWIGLLNNIHPEGSRKGVVVASPSTEAPNYYYHWTRDSALVMRNIVKSYIAGKAEFKGLIEDYISAAEYMQHQETTLGGFHTGGLGDVKYEVSGKPYTGPWSRPQPDGPAARVITLTIYAMYLLDHGTEAEKEFVKTKMYDGLDPTESIIKGDLVYLGESWMTSGFDLWEEVRGSHFYTLLSIQKAFYVGSALAYRLNDHGAAKFYDEQAGIIQKAIVPQFWSEEKEIIRVSMNWTARGGVAEFERFDEDTTHGKTSELDIAVVLATLHSGDSSNWIGSDEILSTLSALTQAMKPVYPLNAKRDIPALGRYPEDIYDGITMTLANPWFLCTLAAAELLYKTNIHLESLTDGQTLYITGLGKKWYSRFAEVEEGMKVVKGSSEMDKILEGQRNLGDGFLQVVKDHVGVNGSMPEQFHRETGIGRGARDLTWSYAAFITAAEARRGGQPKWGTVDLTATLKGRKSLTF